MDTFEILLTVLVAINALAFLYWVHVDSKLTARYDAASARIDANQDASDARHDATNARLDATWTKLMEMIEKRL